ncbi:MAG TPA: hypothetical protein VMC83_09300 [Streptosporangiaceae bacterium]|nr:hypothetical protein [Streptosporangiaceae bacterium]
MSIPLAAAEDIIDASGVAGAIEDLLPGGVRARQLSVRTLLLGMLLALADDRPAHLTRVHQALTLLPQADQARLGVTAGWKTGPHQLTYRQTEHTFRLITAALGKTEPDGAPAEVLQATCDQLVEASIPAAARNATTALAADWTDIESWSRPPRHGTTACADPEAAWGHRNSNLPGPKGEMFFGWFLSAAVMAREENGPAVPELARRMTVSSCRLDPARALAAVLTAMPAAGIGLGDIIADSGYAHRDARAWAIPLRNAGASLVQDLHPHDRGPRGTHHGAIICNGNLYCPATPTALLQLGPLPPGAEPDDIAVHDARAAELARHKLGRHTTDDADGYHRAACPATTGKIRCPLRPESMTRDRSRPEILSVPEQPPACCTQHTITIGPDVAAKTRQKHDYPSPAWRRSYNRRTAAERAFSTIKDPATTTIARGWCRLLGLAPLMLWTCCLLTIRNQRILTTWNNSQADNTRRAAAGLPPRTRKKRRADPAAA